MMAISYEMQALHNAVTDKLGGAKRFMADNKGELFRYAEIEARTYQEVLNLIDKGVEMNAERVASEAPCLRLATAIEGRCIWCGRDNWLEELTVVVSGARIVRQCTMVRLCDSCRMGRLATIGMVIHDWFKEQGKAGA